MSADFGEILERVDAMSDKIAALVNRSINQIEINNARDLEAIGKLQVSVLSLQLDLVKQLKSTSTLPMHSLATSSEAEIARQLESAGNFDSGF